MGTHSPCGPLQVLQEGCAGPQLAPDSPPLLAAEVPAQGSPVAPEALSSHAALLPPVALRRPVALPTVSDSEEVILETGAQPGEGVPLLGTQVF